MTPKQHDGNRDFGQHTSESHKDYPARDTPHIPHPRSPERWSPLYDPDALDLKLKPSGNERELVSKGPQ